MTRPLRICGGQALVDGELRAADLLIADGRIAALETTEHILEENFEIWVHLLFTSHADSRENATK